MGKTRLFRFVPSLPSKKDMLLEPVPAKRLIPEWYRLGESFLPSIHGGEPHPGMKACKPFIDVMISGYMLLTPFDIHVSRLDSGDISITWDGPDDWEGFVGVRPRELGATIPVPAGHDSTHLVWASKWGWKTPRGWSVIVTHPFNRHDLPFTTLSGFMESDNFVANGNIPWYIKSGFEGVIPAGTPFAQLIPVKRSKWYSFADYGLESFAKLQGVNVRRPNLGYKNKAWVKKEYD